MRITPIGLIGLAIFRSVSPNFKPNRDTNLLPQTGSPTSPSNTWTGSSVVRPKAGLVRGLIVWTSLGLIVLIVRRTIGRAASVLEKFASKQYLQTPSLLRREIQTARVGKGTVTPPLCSHWSHTLERSIGSTPSISTSWILYISDNKKLRWLVRPKVEFQWNK